MDILFIIEEEILTVIKWSYPPIMSTVEPKMVSYFEHSPISSKHISTLYLFLDPYLNTYHSNRVVRFVRLKEEIELSKFF